MIVPGYSLLEQLAHEHPALLTAVRDNDGARVLIKCATPLTPMTVTALHREASVLRTLGVGGVPKLVAIVDPPCALVLERPAGKLLSSLLGQSVLCIEHFFVVARGLARALANLHRAGVVHRNLAPAAILIELETEATAFIDFEHASRISEEAFAPRPAHLLGNRLAYASPEQTGRMNRVVDSRSDLYSLGAILYQVLTGRPPFLSVDPLELIHAHVARLPDPPTQVAPGTSEPAGAIVMKLLAKNAEDRYQSAAGLLADLDECAVATAELSGTTKRTFVLGQNDWPERLLIPQRLYGREAELASILQSFEDACHGRAVVLLVHGYAGVGKTAMIQEMHRPIVRRKGLFVGGKFDQLTRNIPYAAFAAAIGELVLQTLGGPAERVDALRSSLTDGLGRNASLVGAVVPELTRLLGPLAPAPALSPTESENRLRHAMRCLLAVFARPEHPLLLFLDDLQWADPATLSLLLSLLSDPLVSNLLILGAYRDNEVSRDHPLQSWLGELGKTDASLRTIALSPLRPEHLAELIGDALRLHDAPDSARALAALVQAKTDGNPFFVTQFLKLLEADGLLAFEPLNRKWVFDLARISRADMTDNVVELLSQKLQKLPFETQTALSLAACMGNAFSLRTLSIISESSRESLARRLRPAVSEGLVRPSGGRYEVLADLAEVGAAGLEVGEVTLRFLHDRVQQAAFLLIPESERAALHLRVGQLLLAEFGTEPKAQRLFEIVDHLNLGRSLVVDPAELRQLVSLNVAAGQQAKASAAFSAALGYFQAAAELLLPAAWKNDHDSSYALHLELGECLSAVGQFEAADRALAALLLRARSRVERARIHNLKIIQSEALTRYQDGIRAAREALSSFGLEFPIEPSAQQAALDNELVRIRELLCERSIMDLIELPTLEDPDVRVLMRLLCNLHTSLYLAGEKILTLLNSSVMVRLTLTHGSAEESAHAYMLHAMHVGQVRGDLAAAFEFGSLALRLSERFPDASVRAKVLMNFSWAVSIFRRPMRESFQFANEAFRLGNETGMFVDSGYAAFNRSYFQLLSGPDLAQVQPAVDAAVAHMRRVKMDLFVDAPLVVGRWAAALQGLTLAPCDLTGDGFSEAAYHDAHNGHSLFEMFLNSASLALCVTFGESEKAVELARRAARAIVDYPGTIWDQLCVFHEALALTAVYPERPCSEQAQLRAKLEGLLARLRHWADNCPENFGGDHLTVAAEVARVTGQDALATQLYERAIVASSPAECPRHRALANELYGRFWLKRGQTHLARVYLADARAAWAAWGAHAKVEQLERRHGELLIAADAEGQQTVSTRTLDLATAMKAAQAISGEIERPSLLRKLVRLAIENAGAERGLLLREQAGELRITAEGRLDQDGVALPDTPASERTDVPWSIVQMVQRTGQAIVLPDAQSSERWMEDAYVRAVGARSVACMPLVQQGEQMGLLYLENNLTAHAFGKQRFEMLQVLAAQAGIALENARLYEELRLLSQRLQAENVYLREEIRTDHNFEEIVGQSPALLEALAAVESVAKTDCSVLILGETGVGKELFARAIHNRSNRRARPLVKVNCGAISAGLVESELFGHVKGAFTGALQKRTGRFELADGGTIFLDEVGELTLDTQVKLLRVLQEREFEPVGSSRTVAVDVRVIAATNRDLLAAVSEGRFRADLMYRLNVFPLRIPSLAERRSDIPLLIKFFCQTLGKRLGKRLDGFSERDMNRLVDAPWPGNIRELANVVERAAVLSQSSTLSLDARISADQYPERVAASDASEAARAARRTLEEMERAHIRQILASTSGVIEGEHGAARILGLHPSTLRSRMKKLGILGRATEARGG